MMRQMYRYTNEQIARICHEACRALQYVQEDPAPSVPWDCESAETRAVAVEGVRAARQGITPRESHEDWMRAKQAQGWAYGPEKDPERRTHPNLVPYDDLPPAQRDKDQMFLAITAALTCCEALTLRAAI